jgi:predicted mannosyl-3-phosphoglycerate phosphatase (HAD superfamily)
MAVFYDSVSHVQPILSRSNGSHMLNLWESINSVSIVVVVGSRPVHDINNSSIKEKVTLNLLANFYRKNSKRYITIVGS